MQLILYEKDRSLEKRNSHNLDTMKFKNHIRSSLDISSALYTRMDCPGSVLTNHASEWSRCSCIFESCMPSPNWHKQPSVASPVDGFERLAQDVAEMSICTELRITRTVCSLPRHWGKAVDLKRVIWPMDRAFNFISIMKQRRYNFSPSIRSHTIRVWYRDTLENRDTDALDLACLRCRRIVDSPKQQFLIVQP